MGEKTRKFVISGVLHNAHNKITRHTPGSSPVEITIDGHFMDNYVYRLEPEWGGLRSLVPFDKPSGFVFRITPRNTSREGWTKAANTLSRFLLEHHK